ncbi:6,7-dimethyl-8-ribityllumazine synthase [Oceanibaculum nanhaiense]|uniref:6,7-dimethyl-8-ribityllumazine synthase n=1 Tax=Oceanibaculum nanhaiense TaxID=1909734 RepID=UPI0025A47FC9|nr:6,7-dimethyl-8-ribityllumazine synthase [Oceanibaculum nanhaiense]MDM7946344.1 6,7-dimethyl-8-ribityllumazine synthase [Oceanibaculum nanhaiense]
MTHVLIVEARFYEDLADELVKGAMAALEAAGVTYDRIAVPGAFEIPAAIGYAAQGGKYAGYVALGCVIRGETTHYDYVCGESARGLQDLAIQRHLAIGYGILTCENGEQAWARASVAKKNKGKDAAEACLAMIELKQRFGVS